MIRSPRIDNLHAAAVFQSTRLVAAADRSQWINDREVFGVWPEPTPEQIEVMLLGTYHMDNPGLDTVNVEADDVLTPSRQRELEDLVDVPEPWNPAKIAVEWPYDTVSQLNERYERYRPAVGSTEPVSLCTP